MQMHKDAMQIIHSAIEAVKGEVCVRNSAKRQDNELIVKEKHFSLDNYERVMVVGAGKAVASMAKAIEEIMPDLISGGYLNVKYGHLESLKKININEASHPIPDYSGMEGANRIMNIAEHLAEKDLLIVLISGGGSALLPLPEDSITLEEKQIATNHLIACGASIDEINAIRKHISKIKGGKLARAAYPATVVSLILSDVIGDRLNSIASGPTAPDSTTFTDCEAIVAKYHLQNVLPPNIIQYIQKGSNGNHPETVKEHDPVFANVSNIIVGSNLIAVQSAQQKASSLNYDTKIISTTIQGDTEQAVHQHAEFIKNELKNLQDSSKRLCLLSGGETTVQVKGKGKGGRNMHFALALLLELKDLPDYRAFCIGTDGTDGPTDAAGAFCDGSSYRKALAMSLDPEQYLANNDSYTFYKQLGNLIITGPTNTNVMDLRVILLGNSP
ncbi:MAG: hypothetical protein A2Y62_17080 [Candidatus Fischerbacteria bacterium RBG_13_37_8]|uniref:Glycerate kinase n=1 Tax=Candidatus Fischerbacteria bacterium RBG_13_37_8 TaxID=1817863 RepID=A0A1F5VFZ6_9BACT|nr:MAG: hypothetical protein A2Y62_17080 [Candidatus Fischerbacteria bacterium RBG_13_37_8]